MNAKNEAGKRREDKKATVQYWVEGHKNGAMSRRFFSDRRRAGDYARFLSLEGYTDRLFVSGLRPDVTDEQAAELTERGIFRMSYQGWFYLSVYKNGRHQYGNTIAGVDL